MPDLPDLPALTSSGGLSATHRSDVGRLTAEDQEVWRDVEARVQESLPEYSVAGIQRLQNAELWRRYARYRHRRAQISETGDPNEKTLFHYASPHVIKAIADEGFETRLGNEGEYGA